MKLEYGRVKIRQAELRDAEQILLAEKKISLDPGQLFHFPHELKLETFQKKIQELDHHPRGTFVVAEVDGVMVGHGIVEPMQDALVQHVAQLITVVHIGHQGKGIGKRLLENLNSWATACSELEKFETKILSVNQRAINLFAKQGFKEEGRRIRRVKVADDTYVDDVLMGRWILNS